MVFERQGEHDSRWAAIESIAEKCGCTSETLRKWVRQAERDAGERPGLTTEERQRLEDLERENRELRRANEILKKASAFFARAELDPLSPVVNLNLARALRTAGKPEEAVERARRAIEIEPGFANAYGLVSDIYSEELNQPDEALRYQKKATEVDRLIPSSRKGVLAQALLLPSRAAASS